MEHHDFRKMEHHLTVDPFPRWKEEITELRVQENIANWQSGKSRLVSLSPTQFDIIYKVKDLLEDQYYKYQPKNEEQDEKPSHLKHVQIPTINSNQDYFHWLVTAENEIKWGSLIDCTTFYDKLQEQSTECESLFKNVTSALNAVQHLQHEYQQVTIKTDSLHNLSDQLMRYQKQLKDSRIKIREHLHYFRLFNNLSDNINSHSNNVCSNVFMETLDKIDECMEYLESHGNFKESKLYTYKYKHLLSKAVMLIRRHFNDIILNATKQVTDPENKVLLSLSDDVSSGSLMSKDLAFALYYGKFQNAAVKIKPIINLVERKIEKHFSYKQLLMDCEQIYFSQRSPVMSDAVTKALMDLKYKHKNDHSILFRSAGVFIMQVCQDETACFKYFFSEYSPQLDEYFGILCQSLYDMLRPCLIGIYHLEVLTELCGILRREMLNDQVQSNDILNKFTETMQQLLEDMEERLVFRTHVFLQTDILSYQPSPGDLAYPEKLEQMENIAEEFIEYRTESRSSVVSIESQEVANITTNQLGQFRSYTGNSPADLHGMWYPTVKRTLVCLSRLYFCLDREIFQGLAQEALSICVETISKAANMISSKKSQTDGRLFQIKHLLILREQIAPFQVDFTIKELSLDFSHLKTAAVSLIQNRDRLFMFSSNNALLEFLLEGTPRVKEYLVDSRKEIDKQLKCSCEAFISHITMLIVGNLLQWIQKSLNCTKICGPTPNPTIHDHEFAKPHVLAALLRTAQRNVKTKIPEVQRSMQLYLANRETEFILFRPIKNGIINAFMQVEQIATTMKYTKEDQAVIACPTPEQINVLICSVSLTIDQDHQSTSTNKSSSPSDKKERIDG